MMEYVNIEELSDPQTLDDYASVAQLTIAVNDLRTEANFLVPKLKDRTIWMVNSTSKGGGVAEMLPKVISIMRELGLDVNWAVIGADREEFFTFTKRMHNLIHGFSDPEITPADREVYESINRKNADEFRSRVRERDILIVHDPQPMALGAFLKQELGIPTIWRSHIGLDVRLPQTSAAWTFLKPYAEHYDHAVFTAPEYIPDYFSGRASIIYPSIDPLSHKNRELSPNKLMGVLCNAQMAKSQHPQLTPFFPEPAERMQWDGSFGPAMSPEEIGIMYRPTVVQISRWDRLKGFQPLLEGFVKLKQDRKANGQKLEVRHRRRREIMRLVLAGPDPASIQDDPEGQEVLDELRQVYVDLDSDIQKDVAILALPMKSRKFNALMVNALQRCATVIVQNSLREGFGLTATEAMFKGVAVLGTQACGLRQQIRDHVDGRLLQNAEDPDEVAGVLDKMLADPSFRHAWGDSARRRVLHEFLIFTQVRNWLRVMVDCVVKQPVTAG